MGENFTAKGSEPEWKMIYAVLIGMQVGQVLEYDMLDAILGRPFLESRTPIYRARKEFFETHHRLLANESGRGYRIIKSDEHEDVARDHIRKGNRQIVTATKIVTETPRAGMSVEGRRSLDALQVHLVTVAEATRALNRRVTGKTAADEALDEVREKEKAAKSRPEPTSAEVVDKLDRLEALFTRFSHAES